jgi:hypothetical protein
MAKKKVIFGWFFCKKEVFEAISSEAYFKRFLGDEDTPAYPSEKNMNRLREAYKKAWECRNFEIDKFWSRSAFFWGFIVLIFTGYITLLTKENNSVSQANGYPIFYLMLMGFLFSLAWLLVIKGSKAWQENWEAHIDYLEDYISGPLYKTIWLSKEYKYYSVSKVNEVLAIITMFVWIGLIIKYIFQYNLCIPFLCTDWKDKIDLEIPIGVFVTCVFSVVLLFGYPAGKYTFSPKSLEKIDGENEEGAFIIRRVIKH